MRADIEQVKVQLKHMQSYLPRAKAQQSEIEAYFKSTVFNPEFIVIDTGRKKKSWNLLIDWSRTKTSAGKTGENN